jgi:hypothetical protein
LPAGTAQTSAEVIVAPGPRSDPPTLPKSVSPGMSTRVADAYDAEPERRDPASKIDDASKAKELKLPVHEKWHRHRRHSSDQANRAHATRTVARHRRRPSVPAEPTQVQQATECPSDGLKPWLRTLNLAPPCQG